MATPGSDDEVATAEPTWGLGEVFGGWVLAVVASTFVSGLVLAAGPWATDQVTDAARTVGTVVGDLAEGRSPSLPEPVPLAVTALLQLPLWGVLVLVPWWATRTKGRGLVRDLGLRMRAVDVPVGLAVGVAAQLVLLPALYWVLFRIIGDQDVSAAARQLTDRATTPLGVVLLFAIVGVGAPIVEEVFFRGLAQGAFEKRGMPWGMAVTCTSLFFAATHLQPLQFPGLFAFGLVLGWLVHRTGRLGPAIWAHVAFNLTAAMVLVWDVGA
jgi:membrane protease YdiL (CAAX protease family)